MVNRIVIKCFIKEKISNLYLDASCAKVCILFLHIISNGNTVYSLMPFSSDPLGHGFYVGYR